MTLEYEKYLNETFESENQASYTITDFINQGGNGYVYECINKRGEKFVVKILHGKGILGDTFTENNIGKQQVR